MARFMVRPRFLCPTCVEARLTSPSTLSGPWRPLENRSAAVARTAAARKARFLEGLDLCRGFDRDVGRVLRVVAVLPVDPLVELIEVELPTLAALEQIAPPVAFIHIGLDQLKALLLWTLDKLRLCPEHALGGLLHG